MHLCSMQRCGWPPKHAPPHMYYHVEFGRSTPKNVIISRREPQNWAALRLRPLQWEALLTPRNTPLSHMSPCRTQKFCVKGCRHKQKKNPKIGSAWVHPPCGGGMSNALEICPSSTSVTLPNLAVLGQTIRAILSRSAWKIWPLVLFQGHWRSSEPTRIDPPPMTSY